MFRSNVSESRFACSSSGGKQVLMLMLGFFFSETQFLLEIDLTVFGYPALFLYYFSFATIYLSFITFQHAFSCGHHRQKYLELYEYIGLPLLVVFLKMLLNIEGSIPIKIVCSMLFVIQNLLIVIKIIYFGSVTRAFAQVSGLIRLVRVLKLGLIVFLPLILSSHSTVSIALAVCQLLTAGLFWLKFTYQRMQMQHYLMLMILCGLVSSCYALLVAILELEFQFIGLILAIIFWFLPVRLLTPLIEMKYSSLFSQKAELKTQEDYLVGFLFTRECLFPRYRSLPLSPSTVNEVIMNVINLMKLFRDARILEERSVDEQTDRLFLSLQEDRSVFGERFFSMVSTSFKNTASLQCLQFLMQCAFDLGGRYIEYILVSFYRFCEGNRKKSSIFQQCRYEILFTRINNCFIFDRVHDEQVRFVELSQDVKKLGELVEKCFEQEIKMVEELINDEKKSGIFSERRLLDRHKRKMGVKKVIKKCVGSSLYIHCNEFKFLLLLFGVGIEKRFSSLQKELKQYFLSSKARALKVQFLSEPLVLLNGFNAGQIVNCNQSFLNVFGQGFRSQANPTISQLFPSSEQKNRHIELMNQSYQSTSPRQKLHSDQICLLSVERESGGVKFKTLLAFNISTRIYYENQNGFNYVCELVRLEEAGEMLTLLRRECDHLEKKGFEVLPKRTFERKQLQESMELWDIEINDDKEFTLAVSDSEPAKQMMDRERRKKTQSYLSDKIVLIDKKLSAESQTAGKMRLNWCQLMVVLLVCIFMMVAINYLQSDIADIIGVKTNQSVAVGRVALTRRRVMLQKMILNFVDGTDLFLDDICADYGIMSLKQFSDSVIETELMTKFDNISLLQYDSTSIHPSFLQRRFWNGVQLPNSPSYVNYLKYLELFKSSLYYYLFSNSSSVVNFTYYQTVLPVLFLTDVTSDKESLYTFIDEDMHTQLHEFSKDVQTFKVVIFLVLLLLAGTAIIMRLRDSLPLLGYLQAVENIKESMLNSRLKELKYALEKLNRFRANGIQSLDFDDGLSFALKTGKKECQQKSLRQFTNYQFNTKDQEMREVDTIAEDQDSLLFGEGEVSSSHSIFQSSVFKVVSYNRWYILLILLLFGGLLFAYLRLFSLYSEQAVLVQNFHQISEQFNTLQEKYINLLAFNWIKVVSLKYAMNMTLPEQLYSDAIGRLETSNLTEMVKEYYPEEFANSILYGNICRYFLNQSACEVYRNGIFKSGLTALLPFTIKEAIESENMSTNYTYFLPELCDRTSLVMSGVLVLTIQIPRESFQHATDQINSIVPGILIGIFLLLVLWVVFTFLCLMLGLGRIARVREQVLSLDSIQNLYTIEQFKPYLNEVYYS